MSEQELFTYLIVAFAGGILTVILGVFVILFIAFMGSDIKKIRRIFSLLSDNEKEEKKPDLIEKVKDIEEEKWLKDPKVLKYLSIPNIVPHYIDKSQVLDFYNDKFRHPIVESVVSENAEEINGEINAGIPKIGGSRVGGKDAIKLTQTMKVTNVSVSYMFLQYQKEMIKSKQVSLGLDEIDVELTELQEFENAISKFQQRFGIKLESNTISDCRVKLKEKAAIKTVKKLENPLSWVLVDGKFKIKKDGEYYKCTFLHPINEYLSKETEYITISTSIPIKKLEPIVAEIYSQSNDAQIPLNVFGRVVRPVNRKDGVWELKVLPICVY